MFINSPKLCCHSTGHSSRSIGPHPQLPVSKNFSWRLEKVEKIFHLILQGKIPEHFIIFLASQTVKIEVENRFWRTSCFLGKSGVYMGVGMLVMEVEEEWDFLLRRCATNINKRPGVQTNIANVVWGPTHSKGREVN